MSSELRAAVLTKLAKMELYAYLLRARGPKFHEYKFRDQYTDGYGRTYNLDGERSTWEMLYADVLQVYRSHLFELEIIFPQVKENAERKSIMDVFAEIGAKKKRGFFGGLKEDYEGKARLLPKFVEIHNMLKAYIKTTLDSKITDDELYNEIRKIEERITVKEEIKLEEPKESETITRPEIKLPPVSSQPPATSQERKHEPVTIPQVPQPIVVVKSVPVIQKGSFEEELEDLLNNLRNTWDKLYEKGVALVRRSEELIKDPSDPMRDVIIRFDNALQVYDREISPDKRNTTYLDNVRAGLLEKDAKELYLHYKTKLETAQKLSGVSGSR